MVFNVYLIPFNIYLVQSTKAFNKYLGVPRKPSGLGSISLSLLWFWPLLWNGFNPWPENVHMPWVQPPKWNKIKIKMLDIRSAPNSAHYWVISPNFDTELKTIVSIHCDTYREQKFYKQPKCCTDWVNPSPVDTHTQWLEPRTFQT